MTFSCTSANVEIWVKNPAKGEPGQEQTGRLATGEPTPVTPSWPLANFFLFSFFLNLRSPLCHHPLHESYVHARKYQQAKEYN